MDAAVTARQRMIVQTGLVLIVLLVLAGAQAVSLLPSVFASRPDTHLLVQTPTDAWYAGAMRFLAVHHRLAGGLLYVAGALGMLLRVGVSFRTLDFLYNDSERADGRGFGVFVADTLIVIAQIALLMAMTSAVAAQRAAMAPLLLLALLLVNALWFCWLSMRTRGHEARSLRGLRGAGLLSLAFLVLLGVYLWCCGEPDAGARSLHATVAGVTMLLLCACEVYVQAATYSKPRRVSFARWVMGLLVALLLLALAGMILYEQLGQDGAASPSAPPAMSDELAPIVPPAADAAPAAAPTE